jgi:hypothetical protein
LGLSIDPRSVGREVRCPECRAVFQVRDRGGSQPVLVPIDDEPQSSRSEREPRPERRRRELPPQAPKRTVIRGKSRFALEAPVLGVFFGTVALLVLIGVVLYPRAAVNGILVLFLCAALAGVAFLATNFGFKNPRLLLDDEHLEMRVGRRETVGQVPIENIAGVESEKRVEQTRDGTVTWFVLIIHLIDSKDRDTWWPGFGGRKGESIEIEDCYMKSLSWISGRIGTKVERYRANRLHGGR